MLIETDHTAESKQSDRRSPQPGNQAILSVTTVTREEKRLQESVAEGSQEGWDKLKDRDVV